MSESLDNFTYKIIKQIGEGAYGKVYHAINLKTGENVALKQIKHSNKGIESLFETAIISSLKHPHLNSSRHAFSTSIHLNIVQDLAQSDMTHTHEKIEGVSEDIKFEIIKRWCFSIAQVVYYLHRLGIIHGDIKGGNVLYFDQDDIRLADFNLSVKMWSQSDRFKRNVGTCACAPPEVLLGKDWGVKVDIWALGCLFYKFVFGKALFPYQNPETDRKKLKQKYYKSILQWADNSPQLDPLINYTKPDLRWGEGQYKLVCDLITRMLKVNEEDRIDMKEVMSHPFFSSMTKSPIYLLETNYKPFDRFRSEKSASEIRKILHPAQHFSKTPLIHTHELALGIYQRVVSNIPDGVNNKKTKMYMMAACCISSKIVTNKSLYIPKYAREIIKYEREVCHFLSYIFPLINSHTLSIFER